MDGVQLIAVAFVLTEILQHVGVAQNDISVNTEWKYAHTQHRQ